MQAIKEHTRVSRGTGKDISVGEVALGIPVRSDSPGKEGNTSFRGYSNDFLKEEFKSIPARELDPLFSDDNYRFLYESAKNYCGLLKKEFAVDYDPDDIEYMYNHFDSLIPGGHNLVIFDMDGRLQFRIDEICHSQTLFYIPCEILDKTKGQFREILLQFFRILKFVHNLTSQRNSYHCEGLFQEIDYNDELIEEGQEAEIEMDDDYVKLLRSYRNGKIGATLDQVDKHPDYAPGELFDIIEKYEPRDDQEKAILTIISKGLDEYLSSEIPIFNYVAAPDYDPESSTPMEANELIMIVYAEDWVSQNMIESINCSCEECESEYFSSGKIELTPNTDVLMEKNDFAKPFLDWVCKLCDLLYAFKEDNNDNK